MADRKKNTGRDKNAAASTGPPRQSTFFISGDGIDREVITTDICRYLGNDALVKPGTHVDKTTGRSQEGFYITAYRPPTTAQLADLRSDSLKWREERRNSARSQGEYPISNTRQDRDKGDEHPRSGGGLYQTSTYGGQMPPPSIPAGQTQYGTDYRVNFPAGSSVMPQPSVPVAYQGPRGYSQADSNYIYSTVPPQQTYPGIEPRVDRVDTAQGQPSWSMQPNPVYASPAVSQSGPGYPGRPAYAYNSGINPNLPAGYGRGELPGTYNESYGPRESGISQPDSQVDYYNNDEEMGDFDEPAPAPAPAHAQSRRGGDRDSRERHDEPRRKGHGRH